MRPSCANGVPFAAAVRTAKVCCFLATPSCSLGCNGTVHVGATPALIMDGVGPAKVSDAVIEEIRGRERKGAIELPRRLLKPGIGSGYWPVLSRAT